MTIKLDENDDLLPEYDLDFSKSKSNRFAEKYNQMVVRVGLAPDVAEEFPTEDSVNEALRDYIRITRQDNPETSVR
ncbi:MAG TPA: hypothetical protein PKD26_08460 [Pyrinomonadaceae bacterium]|nr:hypothetical protein [Pyrinomonadaceae bacterium]